MRLSSVKTYAGLAFKAGAIDATEHALVRQVNGYSVKESRHVDKKRKTTRLGDKKAAAVRIGPGQVVMLKEQPDTPQGRRDALLMCLLLDHGLRCGEVAGLAVEIVFCGGGLQFSGVDGRGGMRRKTAAINAVTVAAR